MFLSQDEVQRLTGLSRPSAQRRWLLEHGFPHEINAIGVPVVLRSVVEERLGAKTSKKAKLPNFAALHSHCTAAATSNDKGTTAGAV